ncbi:DNA-binding protein [Bacillus phage vB_BceH_LY2]|nr:DNA-binding protein [Bacillus phage vB_BceH_LY2]
MAVGTRTVTQQTSLKCCECGQVNTIWRKRSKMKKRNHVKHMECFVCKKTTEHLELRLDNELPAWLRE